jgi:endonuclease YncB( thermonuclease family)
MKTPTATAKRKTWQGRAEILEVHDGDTFRVFVDLGFQIYARLSVRVQGVNCPELPTPAGFAAKNFTTQLLPPGAVVTLDSKRLDLHGRAEAVVYLDDGRDVRTELIRTGHAQPATDRGNI